MGNDAINIFRKVLDDSDSIINEIRIEVFKKLDLGRYDQLNEFVKESLEHFSFNISESQFFEQIRSVVDEEMAKDNIKIKNGETIDYNLFASNLMNQLKKVGQVNLNFDDDFRNLAKSINDKFPLIASDDWYARLSSKKEQLISMINKYNQDIVETLIKLTPQLASELSALDSKAKSNTNSNVSQDFQQPIQQSQEQQTLSTQQQINNQTPSLQSTAQNNIDNEQLISNFVKRCGEKLNEVDLMFKNARAGKSEIAKVYRTLKSFVDNLNDKTFAKSIIDRHTKLNEAAQGVIYDNIIFENVPMLREIFEKYQNLLNEDNIRKANEPEPKAPAPVETYVGATNEEVEELIKQNKYFSLLQSIKKEDAMKYNGFIYTGYSLLVDDWYARASACKTYEEQHDAYFQLYEIYQNFRDYISLEKSNELREQLDRIQDYLRQQAPKSNEDGIRYNDRRNERNQEQHTSAMRR